jgi:hypothetical protein
MEILKFLLKRIATDLPLKDRELTAQVKPTLKLTFDSHILLHLKMEQFDARVVAEALDDDDFPLTLGVKQPESGSVLIVEFKTKKDYIVYIQHYQSVADRHANFTAYAKKHPDLGCDDYQARAIVQPMLIEFRQWKDKFEEKNIPPHLHEIMDELADNFSDWIGIYDFNSFKAEFPDMVEEVNEMLQKQCKTKAKTTPK